VQKEQGKAVIDPEDKQIIHLLRDALDRKATQGTAEFNPPSASTEEHLRTSTETGVGGDLDRPKRQAHGHPA
jgi:hypothetical protein